MLTVTIPDSLTNKINEFASLVYQTPEECVIELLLERIEHDSAYQETMYLAKSNTNKQLLDKAVKDIKLGQYTAHELIDEND